MHNFEFFITVPPSLIFAIKCRKIISNQTLYEPKFYSHYLTYKILFKVIIWK